MTEHKLVDLALMAVVIDEIDKKYATKEETATGGSTLTFATEAEIKALFPSSTPAG